MIQLSMLLPISVEALSICGEYLSIAWLMFKADKRKRIDRVAKIFSLTIIGYAKTPWFCPTVGKQAKPFSLISERDFLNNVTFVLDLLKASGSLLRE